MSHDGRPNRFPTKSGCGYDKVAHRVDRELKAQDVRLTMGGEPTYVGIDEAESPQWNLEAVGPLKRRCGMGLIQGLREENRAGSLAPLRAGEMVSR